MSPAVFTNRGCQGLLFISCQKSLLQNRIVVTMMTFTHLELLVRSIDVCQLFDAHKPWVKQKKITSYIYRSYVCSEYKYKSQIKIKLATQPMAKPPTAPLVIPTGWVPQRPVHSRPIPSPFTTPRYTHNN